MTRTLTITTAEWASVKDGTLWLVREGGPNAIVLHQTPDMHGPSAIPPTPPAEFVQACAPCQTCDGTRTPDDIPCPDCRIELVGPCPNAEGCPAGMAPLSCGRCYQIVQVGGTVTLGHAYAVGQPLPICAENIGHHYFRLAHYGPPESLVGTWALQLAVTA